MVGIDPIAALDRMTWEQASFVAGCIEDARIAEIDLAVVPTVAATGAKFKGYGPGRRRAKLKEREKERLATLPPDEAAAAKEAATLGAFARAGFRINTVKAGEQGG